MASGETTLLEDWELLNRDVLPRLAEGARSGGPRRSWSVGSIEDAVSVAIAYDADHRQRSESEGLDSYASAAGREVGFRPRDLRAVPAGSRQEYFVHADRRWLVDERIAERVLLDDPPDAVDLVTFRAGDDLPALEAATDRVRENGQVLLIGEVPGAAPEGLEEVTSTANGVVYRKRTPAFGRGGCPRRGAGGDRPAACGTKTLAAHREEQRRIEDHAKLAGSLARRFAHRGEPVEDLEQVAMLALVKAASRFDPERNTSFVTYATVSILGELKRHFRDKSWTMRVPRQIQERYLEVKRAREDLTHEVGGEPTAERIAAHLGVNVWEVTAALGAGQNFWASSLEGRYEDSRAWEIPVLESAYDLTLDRLQMQARLGCLEQRELRVLKALYFEGSTQRQLASEMGISQMQVSRIQAKALSKLRN